MRLKAGDIVGGHRVIELAGCGGMGTVYKTEHLITRRIEAMKVLPLGVGSGAEEIQRFEREIQVQARLQHPNIAALYSASRERNAIALIMEYVEGESLASLLARQRLPLDMAARYASQILDALAYAHRNGVFHCDVTPANILITSGGVAKLTDFGLARAATDLGISNAGVATGSPWHMSPEQVRGNDPLDARTDVYGAGTILYEALTGRKLFQVEGAFAILRAHLDAVPTPAPVRPGDPAGAGPGGGEGAGEGCSERFQTAEEFRGAIEAAAAGRRRGVPHGVLAAAGMAAIVCAAAISDPVSASSSRARSRRVSAAASSCARYPDRAAAACAGDSPGCRTGRPGGLRRSARRRPAGLSSTRACASSLAPPCKRKRPTLPYPTRHSSRRPSPRCRPRCRSKRRPRQSRSRRSRPATGSCAPSES